MTTLLVNGRPLYRFSADDRIWLARMLRGESSNPRDWDAQLWTIAQRFAQRNMRYEDTITELVWNFSQPVNPRWERGGVFCSPGGRYASDPGCDEGRLARRDMLRRDHWTPAELREELAAVDRFLEGRTPNPVPGSVNWHESRLAPGNVRIPAPGTSNLFQGPPGWAESTRVTLEPGALGGRSWVPWALGAAGVVAASAAAVVWWRR